MAFNRLADIVLRAGVAFSFLYPPVNALSDPNSWIGYFPQFVRELNASIGLSDLTLLHAFGVFEVLLALWILSGWKIFWPSLAAVGMFLGIVVFNTSQFTVLFRDLSIAAAALALALVHLPKNEKW